MKVEKKYLRWRKKRRRKVEVGEEGEREIKLSKESCGSEERDEEGNKERWGGVGMCRRHRRGGR